MGTSDKLQREQVLCSNPRVSFWEDSILGPCVQADMAKLKPGCSGISILEQENMAKLILCSWVVRSKGKAALQFLSQLSKCGCCAKIGRIELTRLCRNQPQPRGSLNHRFAVVPRPPSRQPWQWAPHRQEHIASRFPCKFFSLYKVRATRKHGMGKAGPKTVSNLQLM